MQEEYFKLPVLMKHKRINMIVKDTPLEEYKDPGDTTLISVYNRKLSEGETRNYTGISMINELDESSFHGINEMFLNSCSDGLKCF